jgi:ParB family chromosome partitioning protein
MATKKALGKGLDALITGIAEEEKGGGEIPLIPLDEINPGRLQPRKSFDSEKIRELAHSIRENGVIQPIVVRKGENGYEIIIGERRYRAAREAGLKEIPAILRDYSDEKSLELALIENVQREDLNPIEEARAYRLIIEREMVTQEELGKRIGKSRSYIANMMRLLDLPDKVQQHVSRGTISVGQAKAIASFDKPADQEALVQRILRENLTVRDVEKITRKNVPRGTIQKKKEPHIEEIEDGLRSKLGTKVSVDYRSGKGTIKIEFYSDEDLERIIEEIID